MHVKTMAPGARTALHSRPASSEKTRASAGIDLAGRRVDCRDMLPLSLVDSLAFGAIRVKRGKGGLERRVAGCGLRGAGCGLRVNAKRADGYRRPSPLDALLSTLYSLLSPLYSLLSTLYSLLSTLYSLLSTLYSPLS